MYRRLIEASSYENGIQYFFGNQTFRNCDEKEFIKFTESPYP